MLLSMEFLVWLMKKSESFAVRFHRKYNAGGKFVWQRGWSVGLCSTLTSTELPKVDRRTVGCPHDANDVVFRAFPDRRCRIPGVSDMWKSLLE